MDGLSQLLSLKVMRVSRPALATAWEPFYSSSSSLSAHSTSSILSLQGKTPLPGHPKTLRDLTHVTEILTLPSAFGAIQLGEMFSSCLSVNNEASIPIEGVQLRVEMQTATSKTILADLGGDGHKLESGDTMENVVHHEIKELGQHVLACTVSYRLPPGHRGTLPSESQDPNIQSFRKFYKFAVTNPLSVKTKVHTPRSPTALLSQVEREKVFLEVHIQNLTPEALWLENIGFECAEDWCAQDANLRLSSTSLSAPTSSLDENDEETIFTGSTALLQSQDTRQYVYILSPKALPPFPVNHAPGSTIPLGRLDISWRSSFGEPGRLLTSTLSRRIPLIQPLAPAPAPGTQQPAVPPKQASALPLHLQRSSTVGTATPPRVGSPQLGSRPMSPPVGPGAGRPGSPFRRNNTSLPSITTPVNISQGHTPAVATPPTTNLSMMHLAVRRPEEAVEADLLVRYIPREEITVDKPFKVGFIARISATAPPYIRGQPKRERIIGLVVQYVQPVSLNPSASSNAGALAGANATGQGGAAGESWTSRLASSSGFNTPSPSPYASPLRGDFPETLTQRLLVASPRTVQRELDAVSDAGAETPGARRVGKGLFDAGEAEVALPPPFYGPEANTTTHDRHVLFLGPSSSFLPPLRISASGNAPSPTSEADHSGAPQGPGHAHNLSIASTTSNTSTVTTDSEAPLSTLIPQTQRAVSSQEFEMEFVCTEVGLRRVGGVRIGVVEDRVVEVSDGEEGGGGGGRREWLREVRMLKEWEVVAEVWAKSLVWR